MNKEFFKAVRLLEEEKGISQEYIFEKIQTAIITATKNKYGDKVVCNIDPEKEKIDVYVRMAVVDEVLEPDSEKTLEEARAYDVNAQVGSFVEIAIDPKDFGRVIAQTAKSVIRQGIREAERELAAKEFSNREQEVVVAKVNTVYADSGDASIEIGRSKLILPKADQIPGEVLSPGQMIKVFVASIKENEGVSYVNVSRKHPGLVKKMFDKEIPEIGEGIVEIKSISREAGSRSKISVWSNDENIDAVGACIGQRGQRVNQIISNLNGEKIDIVRYSEKPEDYISAALAPAEAISVQILDAENKSCRVIVPDSQLSLAIGNKGQNVRLAARLTGWKIDIKPESSI